MAFEPIPRPNVPQDNFFTSGDPFGTSEHENRTVPSYGVARNPSTASLGTSAYPESSRSSAYWGSGGTSSYGGSPTTPQGFPFSNEPQTLEGIPEQGFASPASSPIHTRRPTFPSFSTPVRGSQPSPNPPLINPPQPRSSFRDSRTLSFSSGTTQASAVASSRNSSDNRSSIGSTGQHTIAVSVGPGRVGHVFTMPTAPLLVLFTRDRVQGTLALVTIKLDEKMGLATERCNCRKSGAEGDRCTIAALERDKGKSKLEAFRFDARDGEENWNLAQLAAGRRRSPESQWRNVMRVSIAFESAEDRAIFSGTPNRCRCKMRQSKDLKACFQAGHRGKLGEVQEWHRRMVSASVQAQQETMKEVIVEMGEDDYRF